MRACDKNRSVIWLPGEVKSETETACYLSSLISSNFLRWQGESFSSLLQSLEHALKNKQRNKTESNPSLVETAHHGRKVLGAGLSETTVRMPRNVLQL